LDHFRKEEKQKNRRLRKSGNGRSKKNLIASRKRRKRSKNRRTKRKRRSNRKTSRSLS
jgi:hypothetical protein